MEVFFVVMMACALLGVGVWALVAKTRLFTFTQTDSTQAHPSQAHPSQRRSGDD